MASGSRGKLKASLTVRTCRVQGTGATLVTLLECTPGRPFVQPFLTLCIGSVAEGPAMSGLMRSCPDLHLTWRWRCVPSTERSHWYPCNQTLSLGYWSTGWPRCALEFASRHQLLSTREQSTQTCATDRPLICAFLAFHCSPFLALARRRVFCLYR